MRAVVVTEVGVPPALREFPDPDPSPGLPVARVLAAGLNPVDVVIAAGRLPFRMLAPPSVLGLEGVGELADGRRVYFDEAPAPYGSFAEWAPVDEATVFPLPADLDPAVAVALGVAGMAAWLALDYRAHLVSGENVLVLGATGAVGQLVVQAARLLGAERVVATVRDASGTEAVHGLGCHAAVRLDDPDGVGPALRRAAPDGYDVVIDLTWGDVVQHAIEAAAPGARLVQVGNAAGPSAQIVAPAFRNRGLLLIGHSNFITPPAVRRAAYEQLTSHALAGRLRVDVERIALADFDRAWAWLQQGGLRRKLVLVP